jgi:two-component system, OmpR family, sensor kinase
MAKLVHDLLELARADAGFQVQREPMNLVEVLEAVRDELGAAFGAGAHHRRLRAAAARGRGRPARLKQVVLNLVQNALDAGARNVTLHLERDGRDVRLEVLDDGPGIPAEALPHVFERFYRVDGARSTRGNGSGLGLAIVRWIVQQHGGRSRSARGWGRARCSRSAAGGARRDGRG